jgi:hypothetical protein
MIRFLVFSCSVFTISNVFAQIPIDSIPINQLRIIASHNSYKKKPHPKVLRFLKKFQDKLGEQNNPNFIDYGHLPFSEQFDNYGIRGIELDVNYDPKGGHYKRRRINLFLFGQRQRVKGGALKKPGFKILHISDVDFETNYLTLKSALEALKSWSDSHPDHFPIYINLEAKGSHPADESKTLKRLGFKRCIPFDQKAFLDLEQEISAILTPSQIFKPSDFKKNYSTLQERVVAEGWPLLEELRGRFIFILEGSNNHIYRAFVSPMFFQYGNQSDANTVFLLRNNAVASETEIRELTSQFIVRTRSDAGSVESRANNYDTWNAALRSGAQIISTDYYKADERWSSYKVGFTNGFFEIVRP